MIKDIIHKFVFKKEREEAGVFDDVEKEEADDLTIDENNVTAETAESTSKYSQHDINGSDGDDAADTDAATVSGSTSMREISRATLIALLQRSTLQTVIIPVELLELLKLRTTTTIVPTAAEVPVASVTLKVLPGVLSSSTSTSSSAPFERKFKKASIVIDAVNYSDDSEEDDAANMKQQDIVVQASSPPLKKRKVTSGVFKKQRARLAPVPASPSTSATKKIGEGNQGTRMDQAILSSVSSSIEIAAKKTGDSEDSQETIAVQNKQQLQSSPSKALATISPSTAPLRKCLTSPAVSSGSPTSASAGIWCCDVCQAPFDDFAKACVHEGVCANEKLPTWPSAIPFKKKKSMSCPAAALSTAISPTIAAGPISAEGASFREKKQKKNVAHQYQQKSTPLKRQTRATSILATPVRNPASDPVATSPTATSPTSVARSIAAKEDDVGEQKQKELLIQQQQQSSPSKKPTLATKPYSAIQQLSPSVLTTRPYSAILLKKQKHVNSSEATSPSVSPLTATTRSIDPKQDGVPEKKEEEPVLQELQQLSSPSMKPTPLVTGPYSVILLKREEQDTSLEAASPAATSSPPKKESIASCASATLVIATSRAIRTIGTDRKRRKKITRILAHFPLKEVAESSAATLPVTGTSSAVDEDNNGEKKRETIVQYRHHEQVSHLKVQGKVAISPSATHITKQQVASSPATASPTTTNPSDDEHKQQHLQMQPSKKQKRVTRSSSRRTSSVAKKRKLSASSSAAKKQKIVIDASPAASPPSRKVKLASSSSPAANSSSAAASLPKSSLVAIAPSRRANPFRGRRNAARNASLPPPKVRKESKDPTKGVNLSPILLDHSSSLTVIRDQLKAVATPLAAKQKARVVAEVATMKNNMSPTLEKCQPLRKVECTPMPSTNKVAAPASLLPETVAALDGAPNKRTTPKKVQSTHVTEILEASTNKVKILPTKRTPKAAKLRFPPIVVEEMSKKEPASKSAPAVEAKSTNRTLKIAPKNTAAIPKTVLKLSIQHTTVEEMSKMSESTSKSAPAAKEDSTNKTYKVVPKNKVATTKATAKVQPQPIVVEEANKKPESKERTKPMSKATPTANVTRTSRSKTLQKKVVVLPTTIKTTDVVKDMKKPKPNEQTKLKRKPKSYLMRQLEEHVAPGILSTCHKPKVFPGQLNLRRGCAQEVAGLLLEQLREQLPEHAEEIPLQFNHRASLNHDLPICIISPDRCERGYYKSHLDADFVNSFENSMPECIKIKSAVSKKGIAFISTTAATLSHTHYDQDTSFLLLLTGTKEIFYAPPSMGTLLRTDHPVISHSSNFEGINPFIELTGTSWRFAKLNPGDGLLLPQGWLHAVKSSPGTVAISFQVESAGMDATSPFLRRSRETAPEDIRHLSSIELEEEANNYSSVSPSEKKVVGANVTKQVVKRVVTATAAATSKLLSVVCKKGIASSGVTFKNNLSAADKPAEVTMGLAITSAKPVAVTKGLTTALKLSEHEQILSTITKPDEFKKSLRYGAAKSTTVRSGFPSQSAPNRAESTVGSVVYKVGLSTREIESKKRPKNGLRRSLREKLICGVKDCGRDPAMDASMWVLILSMDSPEARVATRLPMVPTNHPKHLICMECCETRASSIILPEEVLNEKDRTEIKGWNKYLYYSSSKVDYQKWANHAGENGKILQAS